MAGGLCLHIRPMWVQAAQDSGLRGIANQIPFITVGLHPDGVYVEILNIGSRDQSQSSAGAFIVRLAHHPSRISGNNNSSHMITNVHFNSWCQLSHILHRIALTPSQCIHNKLRTLGISEQDESLVRR